MNDTKMGKIIAILDELTKQQRYICNCPNLTGLPATQTKTQTSQTQLNDNWESPKPFQTRSEKPSKQIVQVL